MRILHLNDFACGTGGGAEVYVERLANAQRTIGDDVTVMAPPPRAGRWPVADVWSVDARGRVREAVRRLRPDVVHLHNVARELSPSVLGAAEGVPIVMTVHDLRLVGGYEHPRRSVRGAAERALTSPLLRTQVRRHVRRLVAVSSPVAAALREAGFGPVSTVPVPVVAPAVPLRAPSRSRDIVFAGRLSRDKGCHVLVDAVGILAAAGAPVRLVVAGDGPERDRLVRQAAPLGSAVRFRGRLDPAGVSALLATARAVVVPSIPWLRREGAPLSAAEAARHGRPVIGSDDPGLAELVAGCAGVVVPAGDAGALADALCAMLSDDGYVDEMGRRAAAAAEQRHESVAVARAVRDVYHQVLTRPGSRRSTCRVPR